MDRRPVQSLHHLSLPDHWREAPALTTLEGFAIFFKMAEK